MAEFDHDQRVIRGERCGFENCRSRKYFYQDGYYMCERGHRKEGSAVAGKDDEVGAVGRTTKKKAEAKEARRQHLAGREAFELYLQCYQLLLRYQIRFFTHILQVPAEFEEIVKDLWALRLLTLESRVPDNSTEDAESQYYSSQDEASVSNAETEDEFVVSRRGKKSLSTPNLQEALAVCYLGLQCLRLPYTPGDVLGWVDNQDLIYYQALRKLPDAMVHRLPASYQALLEPTVLLKAEHLRRSILDTMILYQRDHQITFSALNYPVVLFRMIEKLSLPIETYGLVQRLANILDCNFESPDRKMRRAFKANDIPEVQLAVLVVIVVKLVWPFDDTVRYPCAESEYAAARMPWKAWATAHEQPANDTGHDTPAKFLHMTDEKAFDMSGDTVDQYFAWYQELWTNSTPRETYADLQDAMFKMFPVPTGGTKNPQAQISEPSLEQMEADLLRLATVHGTMQAVPFTTKEKALATLGEVPRPGSHYAHWRKVEDLPELARPFFETLGRLVGISTRTLVRAVLSTERKLKAWEKVSSASRPPSRQSES